MKITVDREHDCVYVHLRRGRLPSKGVAKRTEPLRVCQVVLDFDSEERLYGIELLGDGSLARLFPEDQ